MVMSCVVAVYGKIALAIFMFIVSSADSQIIESLRDRRRFLRENVPGPMYRGVDNVARMGVSVNSDLTQNT
jgi:hypothetical protein